MKNQKSKQLLLIFIIANANQFQINGKNLSVTENGMKTINNIYNFSMGSCMSVANKDVTLKNIRGVEYKIMQFFLGYWLRTKG